MSEGPQYTDCIDKADWEGPVASVGTTDIVGAIGAIVAAAAGFGALALGLGFAAAAEIIRKVAHWQLTGKLVCLRNVKRRVFTDPDPDCICVLGTVLDFEKVGEDKSGFEKIDNDFGLNLFLGPNAIAEAATTDFDVLRRAMERGPQGDLIQDPDAPEPAPGDPNPSPGPLKRKDDPSRNFGPMPHGFTGYQRQMMVSAVYPTLVASNAYRDPHELVKVDPIFAQMGDDAYAEVFTAWQGTIVQNGQPLSDDVKSSHLSDLASDPLGDAEVSRIFYTAVEAAYQFKEVSAPAFHCEFEGARIRDVFNALDFAHVDCDTSGFLGFACDLLNFVLSIFLGLPKLLAAAAAWARAEEGKLSNSFDGAGGEIKWGDSLVIRGRWVYDSAHEGWNELHAVRTVQKTPPAPATLAEFIAFHDAWCTELAKVPPSPPPSRDPKKPKKPKGDDDEGFTPPQKNTRDSQKRDENRWVYHPSIDGCLPPAPRDEPAPPLH